MGKCTLKIKILRIGIQLDVSHAFKENSIIYEAIIPNDRSVPFCPIREMPDLLYVEWFGLHRVEHTRKLDAKRRARRRG